MSVYDEDFYERRRLATLALRKLAEELGIENTRLPGMVEACDKASRLIHSARAAVNAWAEFEDDPASYSEYMDGLWDLCHQGTYKFPVPTTEEEAGLTP